jgi:hypothetical protein
MADTTVVPSEDTIAQQFNKILNQKRSKGRTSADVDESLRRLRKQVLTNGIPSEVASTASCHSFHSLF